MRLALAALLVLVLASGCDANERGLLARLRGGPAAAPAPETAIEGGTPAQREALAAIVAALTRAAGSDELKAARIVPAPSAGRHHVVFELRPPPDDAFAGAVAEWQAMVLLPAYAVHLDRAGDPSFAAGSAGSWWEPELGVDVPDGETPEAWLSRGGPVPQGCRDPDALEDDLRQRLESLPLEVVAVRVVEITGCVAGVDAVAPDPRALVAAVAERGFAMPMGDPIPDYEGGLLRVRDRDGTDVLLHSSFPGGRWRFRLAPGFDEAWPNQRAFTHAGP